MTHLPGECSYRRAEEEKEIIRRTSACSHYTPCPIHLQEQPHHRLQRALVIESLFAHRVRAVKPDRYRSPRHPMHLVKRQRPYDVAGNICQTLSRYYLSRHSRAFCSLAH